MRLSRSSRVGDCDIAAGGIDVLMSHRATPGPNGQRGFASGLGFELDATIAVGIANDIVTVSRTQIKRSRLFISISLPSDSWQSYRLCFVRKEQSIRTTAKEGRHVCAGHPPKP